PARRRIFSWLPSISLDLAASRCGAAVNPLGNLKTHITFHIKKGHPGLAKKDIECSLFLQIRTLRWTAC
ncbi:MAG: hypothetical protein PHS86_11350, partial [Syntrophaceae bacterium]|nr:hypothetical protein [Syntrophaceae bacterium]